MRLDGHGLIPVLDAILSVMPIDDFVPEAIFRSTVGKDRDALDPVHEEIIACCARMSQSSRWCLCSGRISIRASRPRTRSCRTGEPRLYANVILKKGVIYP